MFFFLPIADDAPRYRRPWVVYGLILVNVGVHAYAMTLSPQQLDALWQSFASLGPAAGTSGFSYNPLRGISSGFLHIDLMHLAGNMWFLYLFGRTVEGKLGPVRMAGAYTLYLIASDLAQYLLTPTGYNISLGASGGVSGIIGTYWFLFPRYEISFVYFVFALRVWAGVKAFAVHWAVAWWFGWDLLMWYLAHASGAGSNVAHSAHIGGMVAGILGAYLMRKLYMVTLDGEDMLSLWLTRKERRRKRRGIPEPDDDWVPPQVVTEESFDAADPDAPDGPEQPGARPVDDDEPIPFDPDD